MKRTLRIFLVILLCSALVMGLIATANGATPNVYLMAVNDKPVEMTAENMPMVVGGALYVPYTMLSSRATGINLGVSAQYNTTRRTVQVSSGQLTVVFDVQANAAYDGRNNPLDTHAVVRNAMVFLPIAWICSYFGVITYSLPRTPYGTLVRVTNSAVVLNDWEFVDAASTQLAANYARYLASLPQPATPQPTAAPTSRPTAVPTPRPTPQPSATPSPTPTEPPGADAEVVLAYRWGDRAEEAARLLENAGQRALFLFAPEELIPNDGLIRRLAAAGHALGLALDGGTAEECLAQAEEGAALLAAIARYPVLIVEAPALDDGGRTALEEAGYVLWSPHIRADDYGSAPAVMRALDPRQLNRVELTCGEAGLDLSRYLWSAMTAAGCHVRQATAPLLAPAG